MGVFDAKIVTSPMKVNSLSCQTFLFTLNKKSNNHFFFIESGNK